MLPCPLPWHHFHNQANKKWWIKKESNLFPTFQAAKENTLLSDQPHPTVYSHCLNGKVEEIFRRILWSDHFRQFLDSHFRRVQERSCLWVRPLCDIKPIFNHFTISFRGHCAPLHDNIFELSKSNTCWFFVCAVTTVKIDSNICESGFWGGPNFLRQSPDRHLLQLHHVHGGI